MIVFAFMYNACIHESADATVSLHLTKHGAYRALRNNLWGACVRDREAHLQYGGPGADLYRTHEWERRFIQPMEVNP